MEAILNDPVTIYGLAVVLVIAAVMAALSLWWRD